MKYQAWVRTAAGMLAAALIGTGAVLAQTQAQVMTDAAPLPAAERSSSGAVIMMDQPVLAQREAMQAAQERAVDTRTLGAGPSRIVRDTRAREQLEVQRALEDALRQQQGTPK